MNHPLLTLFIYHCVEALPPVRFQPSAWIFRGLIRAYQIALSALCRPNACSRRPAATTAWDASIAMERCATAS